MPVGAAKVMPLGRGHHNVSSRFYRDDGRTTRVRGTRRPNKGTVINVTNWPLPHISDDAPCTAEGPLFEVRGGFECLSWARLRSQGPDHLRWQAAKMHHRTAD